jgi:hypothetical protein
MAGQVLEACRDASVSPQLRTARPARAPASRQPGQQAAGSTAARRQRGHRPGQGTAAADPTTRAHAFHAAMATQGVLWVSARAMSALPSTRPRPLSAIHYPSIVASTQALLAHPVLPCFVSRGTRQGWDGWGHGWQRREIDTILRLFLALLPPRYRRLVSPPSQLAAAAAASQPQLHMPHLPACHMPHAVPLPSSSFAHTRTARRLLIPPNAIVNPHPNANPPPSLLGRL